MPKIKQKEKKVMEYEEASSGFVTLYNYKEPFMKYEQGFGFQGVLLFDGETDKIQCHICGQWFLQLGGHLTREHNMKAEDYKKTVGLSKRTALVGEVVRAKLIATGLKKRLKNLRGMKGRKHTEASKALISANHAGKTRMMQNVNGTCPEQLIERLIAEYKKQGKTPAERNLQFHEALIKTYGTYRNACKFAGLPEQEGERSMISAHKTVAHNAEKIKQKIFDWIYHFYDVNKKLPIKTDFITPEEKKMYKYLLNKGGIKYRDNFFKEVVVKHGKYNSSIAGKFRFSKDELLEFLRNFEKYENRKPSYSDARRGLIPHLSRYSYHFGSWKQALKAAFN